jgi:Leucine-rich repeat (LRR) protein
MSLIETFQGTVVMFQLLICECLSTEDFIHLICTNSTIKNVLCHNYVFPYVKITQYSPCIDPINLLFNNWGGVKQLKIEGIKLSNNDLTKLIRILKEEDSKLTQLNLYSNNIGEEGAKAIGEPPAGVEN